MAVIPKTSSFSFHFCNCIRVMIKISWEYILQRAKYCDYLSSVYFYVDLSQLNINKYISWLFSSFLTDERETAAQNILRNVSVYLFKWVEEISLTLRHWWWWRWWLKQSLDWQRLRHHTILSSKRFIYFGNLSRIQSI